MGLIRFVVSLGIYISMIPELATDQARGIIIRDALTTLICIVQFGITCLLQLRY